MPTAVPIHHNEAVVVRLIYPDFHCAAMLSCELLCLKDKVALHLHGHYILISLAATGKFVRSIQRAPSTYPSTIWISFVDNCDHFANFLVCTSGHGMPAGKKAPVSSRATACGGGSSRFVIGSESTDNALSATFADACAIVPGFAHADVYIFPPCTKCLTESHSRWQEPVLPVREGNRTFAIIYQVRLLIFTGRKPTSSLSAPPIIGIAKFRRKSRWLGGWFFWLCHRLRFLLRRKRLQVLAESDFQISF